MRVVIVEDEEVIREGLSKLICKINKNIQVVSAVQNGKEGLETIIRFRPELVITDIKMPKIDGIEMLTELKNRGIAHKTIILSAYSDFKYAQKAIKLGVSEYILKPISIIDMTQALKNIEAQINSNDILSITKNEKNLNIGDIFKKLLFDEEVKECEIKTFFHSNYGMSINELVGVFVVYIGKKYNEYIDNLKMNLIEVLNEKLYSEYFIIEEKEKKEVIVILFKIRKNEKVYSYLEKLIKTRLRNVEIDDLALGYIEVDGILNIKESINKINENLDWNLVVRENKIIDYKKVNNIYTLPIYYPIDIENELREFICAMEVEKIKRVLDKIISYYKREIYNPKEIKNNIIRFAWAIINITKEIYTSEDNNIDTQRILTSIMLSTTWNEIENTFEYLYNYTICSRMENNKEKEMSILVKRAKSIVHEYYNQGINLDEISSKLNVTPEYLGTQFKKEIGESFSTYIKNYRINKAKKLLIGTNFKLYQISERVGYNDSKYFSKVFKENTNYLPLEYRKIYK